MQTFRRRMPPDGLDASGIQPGLVLRRFRRLDDAKQMAPHHHRCGRHVRGNGSVRPSPSSSGGTRIPACCITSVSMSFSSRRSRPSFSMPIRSCGMTAISCWPTFSKSPNLRPKADKMVAERFGWYCLGIEQHPDPFMPETGRFLVRDFRGRRGHLSLGDRVRDHDHFCTAFSSHMICKVSA